MSREIENKEPTMTEFERAAEELAAKHKKRLDASLDKNHVDYKGTYLKETDHEELSAALAMDVLALLTSHARPAEEDTKLLNWLDSKTTGYGDGIAFRMSVKGRGWRLYEALLEKAPCECVPKPTVREAIRVAMEAEATPAAAQAERGEG